MPTIPPCRRGEIGRHAVLRGQWRKLCRFKSGRRHHTRSGTAKFGGTAFLLPVRYSFFSGLCGGGKGDLVFWIHPGWDMGDAGISIPFASICTIILKNYLIMLQPIEI